LYTPVLMDNATRRVVETLRAAIRAMGMTNGQVERTLGASSGYLSRIFAGRIDLKLEHVRDIAKVLDVQPEELLHLAFADLGQKQLSPNARRIREALRGPEPAPAEGQAAARSGLPGLEAAPGSMEDLMLRTLQRIVGPPARPHWPPSEEEMEELVVQSLRRLFSRAG
jgi:transcriptional regulator with XRE-family HTH domain